MLMAMIGKGWVGQGWAQDDGSEEAQWFPSRPPPLLTDDSTGVEGKPILQSR